MTQTVKLRDGSRARLRPISTADRELVLDAVRRMSPESRYRRFFTVVHDLSPSTLDYLTNVDHVDHEAIIALDLIDGACLGVARYVRRTEAPDTAEVAFAVVDDWQGRGLGRALLTTLTARARQEGITRFYAFVQAENQQSLGMLRGISPPRTEYHGTDLEVAVELPAERGIGTQLGTLLRVAAEGLIEAGQLMRVAPRPALGRAPVEWKSIATVVVGAGGSETAAVVVAGALDLAARFSATLHAVAAYRAAVDRPQALLLVGGVSEQASDRGITCVTHAILGDPSSALIDVCAETDADLLIVGSRGMTGAAAGLIGSVPNTVSHHAPCSVLIVRTA